MSIAGPNIGGTASDVGGGTPTNGVWTNPANAQAEDGSLATNALLLDTEVTNYLKVVNFGFSIPAGATITKISDEIKVSTTSPLVLTSCIGIKSGVDASDEPNLTDIDGALAWIQASLASGTLYATTWTPSDINASTSGFKVRLSSNGFDNPSIGIDAVRRTVTYTPAAGGAPVSQQRTKYNPDYYK